MFSARTSLAAPKVQTYKIKPVFLYIVYGSGDGMANVLSPKLSFEVLSEAIDVAFVLYALTVITLFITVIYMEYRDYRNRCNRKRYNRDRCNRKQYNRDRYKKKQ